MPTQAKTVPEETMEMNEAGITGSYDRDSRGHDVDHPSATVAANFRGLAMASYFVRIVNCLTSEPA
jgi:hypothetical protein